jgi:hypothetical protein
VRSGRAKLAAIERRYKPADSLEYLRGVAFTFRALAGCKRTAKVPGLPARLPALAEAVGALADDVAVLDAGQ